MDVDIHQQPKSLPITAIESGQRYVLRHGNGVCGCANVSRDTL